MGGFGLRHVCRARPCPQLVCRRENPVAGSHHRLSPPECRSRGRIVLPADGFEFFLQLFRSPLRHHIRKGLVLVRRAAHSAAELPQGLLVEPLQRPLEDGRRDAPRFVDGVGSAVDRYALGDGEVGKPAHDLRSRPYPHRPPDEGDAGVGLQQGVVELRRAVVVADHPVAPRRTYAGERAFVHPPACEEKQQFRFVISCQKQLLHRFIVFSVGLYYLFYRLVYTLLSVCLRSVKPVCLAFTNLFISSLSTFFITPSSLFTLFQVSLSCFWQSVYAQSDRLVLLLYSLFIPSLSVSFITSSRLFMLSQADLSCFCQSVYRFYQPLYIVFRQVCRQREAEAGSAFGNCGRAYGEDVESFPLQFVCFEHGGFACSRNERDDVALRRTIVSFCRQRLFQRRADA